MTVAPQKQKALSGETGRVALKGLNGSASAAWQGDIAPKMLSGQSFTAFRHPFRYVLNISSTGTSMIVQALQSPIAIAKLEFLPNLSSERCPPDGSR
jgi:hypothetical protein